jgi:hypothetical protein
LRSWRRSAAGVFRRLLQWVQQRNPSYSLQQVHLMQHQRMDEQSVRESARFPPPPQQLQSAVAAQHAAQAQQPNSSVPPAAAAVMAAEAQEQEATDIIVGVNKSLHDFDSGYAAAAAAAAAPGEEQPIDIHQAVTTAAAANFDQLLVSHASRSHLEFVLFRGTDYCC